MPRQPTPRQVLWAHIRECHSLHRQPGTNITFAQLKRWHVTQHHRFSPNHTHGPNPNIGPGHRPEGWYTGLYVIMKGAETFKVIKPIKTEETS